MFDYARRMQLALTDTVRRSAFKAGAGVVIAIGAGFLMAALWTFLAHHLGWGSLAASAVIGGVFVLIGIGVIFAAGKVRHPAPTTDDLKREVETRMALASEQLSDMAMAKAQALTGMASQRVQSLVDQVGFKASELADDAEARVQHFANDTAVRAARSVGLTRENLNEVKTAACQVRNSNAAAVGGLVGAFAVGIALASRIGGRSDEQVFDDESYYYDDYDDAY